MDVTRDTFEAALDALDEAIADPHFAFWTFDAEFTGLCASEEAAFDLLDTPAERFAKTHASVRAFTVLQYGVCLFAHDPSTRRWRARPFNFWLFPDDASREGGVFSCQASSMRFLADAGFDVTRAIARGVPFLPKAERERARERRRHLAERPPIVPNNERDRAFVRTLRERVAAWLRAGDERTEQTEHTEHTERTSPTRNNNGSLRRDERATNRLGDDDPDRLTLDPVNGFLRALTYQTLERGGFRTGEPGRVDSAFGRLGRSAREKNQSADPDDLDDPGFLVSTDRGADGRGAPRITLVRASRAEVAADRAAREAERLRAEKVREGFSTALERLAGSGAPAVGHNALYDCAFTMEKFLAERVEDYAGFKNAFDRAFRGSFYDTKLIAAEHADDLRLCDGGAGDADACASSDPHTPRLDTALEPLYSRLVAEPLFPPGEEEEKNFLSRGPGPGGRGPGGDAFRNGGERVLDWIEFPPGFDKYASCLEDGARIGEDRGADRGGGFAEFAHEAGFDAFATGACFAAMLLRGAARGAKNPPEEDRGDDAVSVGLDDDLVDARPRHRRGFVGGFGAVPFRASLDGAVPLQRSLDLRCLRFRGDDPTPDRSAVVYVLEPPEGGSSGATPPGEMARRVREAGLGPHACQRVKVPGAFANALRLVPIVEESKACSRGEDSRSKDSRSKDSRIGGGGSEAYAERVRSTLADRGDAREVWSHERWLRERRRRAGGRKRSLSLGGDSPDRDVEEGGGAKRRRRFGGEGMGSRCAVM